MSTIYLVRLGAFIGILPLLVNCSSQDPAGLRLKGTVSGFVNLINADGSRPEIQDSVKVSFEGSSLFTYTDSSGQWSFDNVETGIYTIVFEKNGFGVSKVNQFQFSGGGDKIVGTTELCRPPAFSVKHLWARKQAAPSLQWYLGFTLSDSTVDQMGRVFVFVDYDSTVSSDTQHRGGYFTENLVFNTGVDSTSAKLEAISFVNNGFLSGDTVYIVAYAANAGNANSGFLDPQTGATIFTNLNAAPSNRVRVVVP
ncbi:MAG: carboxypeptidase-like regulatory domain-containing protein [Chitinivibrionales bacterium]|nr:carboxypeptidase-like regulatory domain-containing protein [Chitinivibrionales bacterium]